METQVKNNDPKFLDELRDDNRVEPLKKTVESKTVKKSVSGSDFKFTKRMPNVKRSVHSNTNWFEKFTTLNYNL